MADLSASRQPPVVLASAAVHVLHPARRFVLRGDESARAAAERALGTSVPTIACRAGSQGARAALWLGPDEWLLITGADDADAQMRLENELSGRAHSLVDVSHRQVALAVTGADATLLLASGCALELDERAFPVGMCTRTMLGKAEVLLWRTGPAEFRLEVWRSFAPYVTQFLAEAGRGIH
jgi:sarcosine oxidase, subunit gamma